MSRAAPFAALRRPVHLSAISGQNLQPGAIVAGRYRLDRLLGQGGMGIVWAATHTVTRRAVAIKFLRGAAHGRAELRRRFLREARAAATVTHPNVVEVLDVFELEGETPVMVMDLLHGETLGQRISRRQQLPLSEAAALLVPAISAIGTAHARGIVHRDLKPDNIFLSSTTAGEVVKVLDFGIAKLTMHAADAAGVTETGSTLGTPCYMAPEQAVAEKDIDHRVDIWALGIILYECLSGVRPIEGDSIGQIVMHLMSTGITPVERLVANLPEDVAGLVGRMLSRERSRRPDDLREVARVLEQHTDVRAPEFGPPGSAVTEADISDSFDVLPAKIVVSAGGADAHSETQRASDSLPHAMSSTVRSPPRRRRVLVATAVALLLAGTGAWLFTRGGPAPTATVEEQHTTPATLAAERRAAPPEPSPAAEIPPPPAPTAAPVAEPTTSTPKPDASRTATKKRPPRSAETASPPAPAASSAPGPSARPPRSFKGGLAETPPF